MAIKSAGAFVSYIPESRVRRARRRHLAAVLVIAAIASSSLLLQSFYSPHPSVPSAAPAPAAFAYFPH